MAAFEVSLPILPPASAQMMNTSSTIQQECGFDGVSDCEDDGMVAFSQGITAKHQGRATLDERDFLAASTDNPFEPEQIAKQGWRSLRRVVTAQKVKTHTELLLASVRQGKTHDIPPPASTGHVHHVMFREPEEGEDLCLEDGAVNDRKRRARSEPGGEAHIAGILQLAADMRKSSQQKKTGLLSRWTFQGRRADSMDSDESFQGRSSSRRSRGGWSETVRGQMLKKRGMSFTKIVKSLWQNSQKQEQQVTFVNTAPIEQTPEPTSDFIKQAPKPPSARSLGDGTYSDGFSDDDVEEAPNTQVSLNSCPSLTNPLLSLTSSIDGGRSYATEQLYQALAQAYDDEHGDVSDHLPGANSTSLPLTGAVQAKGDTAAYAIATNRSLTKIASDLGMVRAASSAASGAGARSEMSAKHIGGHKSTASGASTSVPVRTEAGARTESTCTSGVATTMATEHRASDTLTRCKQQVESALQPVQPMTTDDLMMLSEALAQVGKYKGLTDQDLQRMVAIATSRVLVGVLPLSSEALTKVRQELADLEHRLIEQMTETPMVDDVCRRSASFAVDRPPQQPVHNPDTPSHPLVRVHWSDSEAGSESPVCMPKGCRSRSSCASARSSVGSMVPDAVGNCNANFPAAHAGLPFAPLHEEPSSESTPDSPLNVQPAMVQTIASPASVSTSVAGEPFLTQPPVLSHSPLSWETDSVASVGGPSAAEVPEPAQWAAAQLQDTFEDIYIRSSGRDGFTSEQERELRDVAYNEFMLGVPDCAHSAPASVPPFRLLTPVVRSCRDMEGTLKRLKQAKAVISHTCSSFDGQLGNSQAAAAGQMCRSGSALTDMTLRATEVPMGSQESVGGSLATVRTPVMSPGAAEASSSIPKTSLRIKALHGWTSGDGCDGLRVCGSTEADRMNVLQSSLLFSSSQQPQECDLTAGSRTSAGSEHSGGAHRRGASLGSLFCASKQQRSSKEVRKIRCSLGSLNTAHGTDGAHQCSKHYGCVHGELTARDEFILDSESEQMSVVGPR